jgi:hypothetical protein
MTRWPRQCPLAAAVPVAILMNGACAGSAMAHVKWFGAYSVAGQPRGLETVLCPDFTFLLGLSLLALILGCLIEGSTLGAATLRFMDRVTRVLRDNTELMLRAGCAFFFVAIWGMGGILLTPELKTDSVIVGALQLGIAAGMLSRATMPLSGLGIAVLFAIAVRQYGAFHLADYPVFLGVAAYLGLTGFQRDLLGARPIDVVRWSAAVTLMWASIEKWAYPEWSFSLLTQHPMMSLGFDPEFFMLAAGMIEFALGFALLWTLLVRRFAAVILSAMFISAVFEFGKIDLVGHTVIIVALLAIVADNGRQDISVRDQWIVPVGFAAALSAFLAIYYFTHAMLFEAAVI